MRAGDSVAFPSSPGWGELLWASPGRAGVVAAETKQGLSQLCVELVTIHTGNFTGKRFNSLKLLTMRMRTCSVGKNVYIRLVQRVALQGQRGEKVKE